MGCWLIPQELTQGPLRGSGIPGQEHLRAYAFGVVFFQALQLLPQALQRLSAKSLNAFLVDPQQRKAFPVIAPPLPWVSPSGEKYIASKVPGSEEKGLPCRQPALLWQVTRGPFFPPFLSHGIGSLLLSFKLALRHSDSSSDFLLECTLSVKGVFHGECAARTPSRQRARQRPPCWAEVLQTFPHACSWLRLAKTNRGCTKKNQKTFLGKKNLPKLWRVNCGKI